MGSLLISELRSLVAQRQVVLLVGTGVSVGATDRAPAASWVGLLRHGVERCEELYPDLRKGWGDRQRQAITSPDTDEMISAAENIARKLSAPAGPEYRRWLEESVGTLQVKRPDVLEALRDLNLPIVTTNYDGLLAQVTGLPAVSWRERARVEQVLRGTEKGILHVHGHWQQPESVVLGMRSYEQVSGDEHAQTVLKALRVTHTLLFVGYGAGLEDPNFGPFLGWTRRVLSEGTARHFRLALEAEVPGVQAQHPPEERIFVLPYGSSHGDLAPFLRALIAKPAAPAGLAPPRTSGASPSWEVKPLTLIRGDCFGRDRLVAGLVATLLDEPPTPTIVLGPPGIGKSTVTIEALYHPEVISRFGSRRHLVRLDGATSAESMIREIAHTLDVGHDAVLSALGGAPSLLVLDNMETPWWSDRVGVEGLLSTLRSVTGLALVASLRGNEQPRLRGARTPIRVPPLDRAAATNLLCSLAGEEHREDPLLAAVLDALDGVPLAIALFGREANGAGLELTWKRWESERTDMFAQPEDSVAVSLIVSLTSPRMTPEAHRLLAVLAQMPDGMPIDRLGGFLSGAGYLAASVLCKVGLAYHGASSLRMLAPLREHISRHYAPREEDRAWVLSQNIALPPPTWIV